MPPSDGFLGWKNRSTSALADHPRLLWLYQALASHLGERPALSSPGV